MTDLTPIDDKLAYHAPVLEVYGTMAELTAAGPGNPSMPFDNANGYVAGVS